MKSQTKARASMGARGGCRWMHQVQGPTHIIGWRIRQHMVVLLLFLAMQLKGVRTTLSEVTVPADPKFSAPITNVTVPVGREGVMSCSVEDLGNYKVAWLRVDTQTILTIQNHVITKNSRVGIVDTEMKTWQLKIKDIKQSDKGWYMCQINTDPMKSQMGFLDVVVPPDILDYPTSTDMVEREGSNVTLVCAARGSPKPVITWRRENNAPFTVGTGPEVTSVEGSSIHIVRVNRLHMGPYLCIASNGVPPSVSKRIMLIVHFPPMISIQNQLVGALEGSKVTLECLSEAYPRSINYWTKENGEIVPQGGNFETTYIDNAYKVRMRLSIKAVNLSDFGTYKCVAKNSLGDNDGTIKLYQILHETVAKSDSYYTARPKLKPRKGNVKLDGNGVALANGEDGRKVQRKGVILSEFPDDVFDFPTSASIRISSVAVGETWIFVLISVAVFQCNFYTIALWEGNEGE